MKYSDAINMMLTDSKGGFKNILASSEEYRSEIKSKITDAKCSIATARVFIGFIELSMEMGKPVKLGTTMLEAAIFIGNGMGFDPTTYSVDINAQDLIELSAVAAFKG